MSVERCFLDTNVLVYAFNQGDWRKQRAQELVGPTALVSVQVLNEFVSVGRRKLRMSWTEIREAIEAITLVIPEPRPLTREIHQAAVGLAETQGYHIYDSLIIASALEAGCTVLYSEDMQHGQTIDGLTIRNPFR
jgi:predicted nucleic acid-binding protein